MPTIEDLRVSYASNVEMVAKRDAQALNSVADAAEAVDQKITRTTKSGLAYVNRFDAVTKSANALAKAQKELEAAQTAVDTALAKGTVTTEQAERALDGLRDRVALATEKHKAAQEAVSGAAESTDTHTAAVTKNTGAIKLQSYQVAQVADEFHKWVDQVLAGGSALTATTYQLPNMVQAMGGLGNATKLVGGFLAGPGGLVLAAAAVGASLVGLGAHAEEETSRLAKLSTQLRATRADAGAMAEEITSASDSMKQMPGWTEESSRQAATAIGSTYNFSGTAGDITSLSNIARNSGSIFGTLADGIKAVTTAMTDPEAEIKALYQQHLPGVDAALVEQVSRLQAAGEQGEAYALVIGKIDEATHDAHENFLTPFQKSLEDLSKAAAPLIKTIDDLAVSVGTYMVEGVTRLLNVTKGSDFQYKEGTAPQTATGDVTGSVLHVNKAHPEMVGLMQINTSYKPKYDVNTLDGNIDEGISRFKNFFKQAGNIPDAIALYGGAKPGSANAKQYLDYIGQQVISKLPPVISGHIDREASKFGLDQGYANILKMLAMGESSGKQWEDQGYANVSAGASPEHAKSAAVINNTASLQGDIAAGASVDESITAKRADLTANISKYEKLSDAATAGSVKQKEYNEQLEQMRVELANTLTPQEKITQGLKDGLTPLQAQSGYWRSMAEVTARFGQTARGTTIDQNELNSALIIKQQQLAVAYNDGTVAAQRQAASQEEIAKAAGGSNAELQHAINYQQAYNEALQDFDPNSAAFTKAVKERTDALDASARSQQEMQTAQQNSGLRDNLTLIKAETASIGQNADQRQVMLSVMQAGMEMHQKYGQVLPAEAQDYIALTGAVAQANAEYQHHEQVLQDVTGSLSNMTDQLTDGITQGFLQGTASGMSFKNVLQGIETQVVGMLVKLSLINPMLNKIDGGTRTTMGDFMNLFTSASDSSSAAGQAVSNSGWASGNMQSMLSSIPSTNSASSNPFGSLSEIMSGNGGLLSSRGLSAAGTLGGAASLGGGMLGGVSMGYSIGKVAANLTGGGKNGSLGAGIGSGVGSIAGGILGGPMGSMIGGLVLGAIGGAIGGATSKKHYVYDSVIGSGGALSIGGSRVRRSSDDVSSGLQTDLDAINAVYSDAGITASGGYHGEVGHYKKGKKSSTTTLEDLLPSIALSSSDATENLALQQIMPKSFDSVESYVQAISSIKQLADTLDQLHVSVSKFDDATHVTVSHISGYTGDLAEVLSGFDGKTVSTSALQSQISTLKSLLDITDNGSQSLISQVADLTQNYQQAADAAKQYGLDYQVILDKGNAVAQQMLSAETTKLAQSDQSVQARYMAATGDQQGADLANFDVSADQQRQSLQDEWRSYLGDSYADNQTYATQMADLDKTLAAERLKIQQTYAGTSLSQQESYLSQAQQSIAGVFTNLNTYVQGLNISDASPLSAQQKYEAANENFQTDYKAAMGGDYDAFSRIQSDAQNRLSLAQTYMGSGTQYAQLYQQTLSKLQSLTGLNTDTLTASIMQKLTQAQVSAQAQTTQAVLALKKTFETEFRQVALAMATKK